MKLVLDTSALISAAILKGSITDRAIRKAFTDHSIIRSLPVTTELEVTLKKKKFEKYFRSEYEKDLFIHLYRLQSKLIKVNHTVSICRDQSDNMFLELALSGQADLIITSDPDLLILNPFENISIVTPKEFLEKF